MSFKKSIMPIVLLGACVKPVVPEGYITADPEIANVFSENVKDIGNYDPKSNTIRYSPFMPNSDQTFTQYSSILELSNQDKPETLYFRVTTPTIREGSCIELFVDKHPFGDLNKREDSFRLSGDCRDIYGRTTEKQLEQKSRLYSEESRFFTFNLRHINPELREFIGARYLENLVVASGQLETLSNKRINKDYTF